jgi:hypothetical protein
MITGNIICGQQPTSSPAQSAAIPAETLAEPTPAS